MPQYFNHVSVGPLLNKLDSPDFAWRTKNLPWDELNVLKRKLNLKNKKTIEDYRYKSSTLSQNVRLWTTGRNRRNSPLPIFQNELVGRINEYKCSIGFSFGIQWLLIERASNFSLEGRWVFRTIKGVVRSVCQSTSIPNKRQRVGS
jgi:hypothetical protein